MCSRRGDRNDGCALRPNVEGSVLDVRLPGRLLGRCPASRRPQVFRQAALRHHHPRHSAAQPSSVPERPVRLPRVRARLPERYRLKERSLKTSPARPLQGMWNKEYNDRLKLLNTHSLEYRRLYIDLGFMFPALK